MPTKLPSYVPKFEGKQGEDPGNHVMTFHMWCSSNIITEYIIHLRFFQCTLTGAMVKWYIGQPFKAHENFGSIATAFLTFFNS